MEFKNESKKILTYTSYKAETEFRGRKYTAHQLLFWYTKYLPFQDGPYNSSRFTRLIFYDKNKTSIIRY